jgi:hypothetical protein
MQGATIQLFQGDSTHYVKGVISSANGQYLLSDIVPGQYIIRISNVGYDTQKLALTLPDRSGNYKASDVKLEPTAIMLAEAVIIGKAPEMQVVEDTTVYNSSAFTVPEGSAVEELLKKLPGVDTDDDGKLTVNGKVVSKILVDGKEFFGKNQALTLKNLPADIVEKIKTYENKSDKARITGIDDGEEETVLDLSIKKGMKKGWFGNLDAAYGTKDRYSEKMNLHRFVDKKQFSVVGSINNVNDNNFPGGGNRFRGNRGNGNGQSTNKMAGFNFATETSKLEMGGSTQITRRNSHSETWTNSQSFESTRAAYNNRYAASHNGNTSFSMDYRLEWRPDSMTNIMLRPNFSYNESSSYGDNQSAAFKQDPYAVEGITDPLSQLDLLRSIGVNHNQNASRNKAHSTSGGSSLQLYRRLNSKGRSITLGGGFGWGDNSNNSSSYAQIDYYQILAASGGDSVYHKIQYNNSPTSSHNYNVSFSYNEPIFNKVYLQFSYNFQYSYQNSDRTVSSLFDPYLSQLGANLDSYNNFAPYASRDTAQCKYVENIYNKHDLRLQLNIIRTNFTLTAGINVQPQHSSTKYTKGNKDFDISRTVANVAPTINFRYRFSKREQFRFTYRGSTGQPNITDLIPDTLENNNPLNIRLGNAGLKPSFTHTINLDYNKSIPDLQRSYDVNASYRTTQNSVSNRTEYNDVTGGRVTQPENINGNWNASSSFNFNTAFSDTRFRINTTSGVNYTNSVGYSYISREKTTVKRNTGTLNMNERLRGTFRTDVVELSANGSFRYNHSKSSTTAAANLDTYTFSYGMSGNLYLPWNMSLSTDISQNSRRGYSDASMNTNELLWNLQIAQRFLRKNAATVSLQFYDILHQQSNVSRMINATSRTDMRYNTINSYCMLHFIYRLNLFGGHRVRSRSSNQNSFDAQNSRSGNTRRENRSSDRQSLGGNDNYNSHF